MKRVEGKWYNGWSYGELLWDVFAELVCLLVACHSRRITVWVIQVLCTA